MSKNKPNILLAIADDASHMEAYGCDFVNTPNFNQVAEEGILFENAFTSNPKCAPSRASLLTGRHTWQLEDACNHFGIFPAKFEVYPNLLEEAGYFIGYTGKGWAPGDWEKGGFSHNPAGHEYNEIRLEPPADSCISDKDYTGNFEKFLKERPKDKPFCFWYGGHEPHRPYTQDKEGTKAVNTINEVEVPSYLPQEEVVKNDLLDYAFEIEWFDQHLGQMIAKLKEIGEYENTLIVVTSDNGMPFPRVKGQMYEQDFNLPLAMCWKNKTGGKREVKDLINFIDLAPTFLEAAGLEVPGEMSGKSLMNIIDSAQSGQVDETRNRVYLGRERHDLGRKNDYGYPVRCVRTEKYLYVHNFKPDRWPAGNPETGFTNCDSSPTKSLILKQHEQGKDYYYNLAFGKRPREELYNIIDDPECINNLADKAEYEELKQKLWEELIEKLEETGDPRIFGNGDVFDKEYEYQGNPPHSWKAYKEGWWEPQSY
ncbi:MAG: sulfatase [Halanaerobiaceae bacterium]